MSSTIHFNLDMQVRDYECDMQGIVNNAVYMNYFEHARHELLNHTGIGFKALVEEGIYLVLFRAEVDYFKPLQSGDRFQVHCTVKDRAGAKIIIEQEIYKTELITRCIAHIAGMSKDGKLLRPRDYYDKVFRTE